MSKLKYSYKTREEEAKLIQYYTELLDEKTIPSVARQKTFLLQLLITKISQLEPKTTRIRFINSGLRIAVMVLSAISTVILGLKLTAVNWSTHASNTALVITAIVTFLSGLIVFWDTENYWIRNKIMLNKLKELRYEYAFYLEGVVVPNSGHLKKFLDKFLDALGDEYWEKFLKNIRETAAENQPGNSVSKQDHSVPVTA